MKTGLILLFITFIPLLHGQSSKDLLRDGLFAEESEGDLKTATEKYEALLKAFEAERKVAAVALFRLAAVKRKQGEEKAALALYEEFGKKFGNVEPQATLVRENYLAISGKEFPSAEGGFTEEDKELARIKKLQVTSPDLFPNLAEFSTYVSQGESEIVAYLLKEGADPNHQGAVRLGEHAYAKILLELGAKVDLCRPGDGVRALHLACIAGDEKMIKILLEAGADPIARTSDEKPDVAPHTRDAYPARYKEIGLPAGSSPLDVIPFEKARILIEAGAKISPEIFVKAAGAKDIALVDYFISKGADVNGRTSSSYPQDELPLNRAFVRKDEKMVEHLISKGAKLSEVAWEFLPSKYRIQSARENRYGKLAESGKVHVVFPEASQLDSAVFAVDYDSQIISNLLKLKLPKEVHNGSERREINYDRVTWNLVRAGKIGKIDWNQEESFQLAAGDILEVTGFGDFSQNSQFTSFAPLERISGRFSDGVRRLARFPIKITHASSNWRYDSPVEVRVERPNFPKFTFRSNGEVHNGFELKAGDHISFLVIPYGSLDDSGETLSRWETNYRREGIGLRVPGAFLGG